MHFVAPRTLLLLVTGSRLLLPVLISLGQSNPYTHNAVSCERCHNIPSKFGASPRTVQRMGISIEGRFFPSYEGGIHHRNGESAQSSASAKSITGDRVAVNLLGDGYIEAIDSRDIEQNAQQQLKANLGMAGMVVRAPVLEAADLRPKCR
jgi:hypothetical protein